MSSAVRKTPWSPVDAREVVEAVVVVGGGGLAPVLLEQRHHVRVGGVPEPLLLAAADRLDVGGEVRGGGRGHRQVAGQQVEQGGDVGAALDAGVPAQGEDAAAGAPDVAQQQLHDRPGADVLRAHAVLGPAHAVDQRGGALAAGVGRPGVAHRAELRPATPRRPPRRTPACSARSAVSGSGRRSRGAAGSGRSPRPRRLDRRAARAVRVGLPPEGASRRRVASSAARYCQLAVS